MKRVFADAGYWVALLDPSDDLHPKALELSRSLGAARLYTTEMVLVEVANILGKGDPASVAWCSRPSPAFDKIQMSPLNPKPAHYFTKRLISMLRTPTSIGVSRIALPSW